MRMRAFEAGPDAMGGDRHAEQLQGRDVGEDFPKRSLRPRHLGARPAGLPET